MALPTGMARFEYSRIKSVVREGQWCCTLRGHCAFVLFVCKIKGINTPDSHRSGRWRTAVTVIALTSCVSKLNAIEFVYMRCLYLHLLPLHINRGVEVVNTLPQALFE